MSEDKNHCCCSHDHEHEHEHKDSCAHDHDNCCSNQNQSTCGTENGSSCGCHDSVIYITEEERAFLMRLSQLPFLPLARFVMKSSKSDHMESVALEPVYLQDKNDSMETVKSTGVVLRALEDKDMITLDYDMPLQNGDYSIYEESALYHLFCSTVQEGGNQGGFIFDLPVLERGSMALTALGQHALDSVE